MKRQRYSEGKSVSIPNEHAAGASVPDWSRHDGNATNTIHRFRSKLGGMEASVPEGALTDGRFEKRYDDGYALTLSVLPGRLSGGDDDRWASYVDRVREVTKADVLEAAFGL